MKYIFMLLFLAFAVKAIASVQTRTVEYTQEDTALEGYFAYDNTVKGARPAVLVLHEWWGVNDYIKKRTEQLAALGYVAFAADIYGKGIRAKSRAEAMALA